jgi:hypothetical protein
MHYLSLWHFLQYDWNWTAVILLAFIIGVFAERSG